MLNKQQIDQFSKTGILVIKKFFQKKDINNNKIKILNYISKKDMSNEHLYLEKGSKIVRRIENVTSQIKYTKKILKSKKLNNVIIQLLGKNSLFKDKVNFKFPGGKGFEPHIDGHFLWSNKNGKLKKGWKEYSNNFINAVIPLQNSNKNNGCLYLANKQYTAKHLGKSWDEINKKIVKFTPKLKKIYNKKIKYVPYELNTGDVLLFDWKVSHYSKNNNSNVSRIIFYATYAKTNMSERNLKNKYYKDKLSSKNKKFNKSLS